MYARRILMAAFLALAACGGEDPEGGDGGEGGAGGRDGRIPCTIGENREPSSAADLELGESRSGHTCPRRDVDWFRFVVPQGQPLVTMEVGYSEGAISSVSLAYEIYREGDLETPVASAADADTSDRRSILRRRHFLGAEGGTFLVRIRDSADAADDARNAWTIQVTAEAEPDPNEPNDSCANATELDESGGGAISYEADTDAFSFDVEASQVVEVRARSEATKVALQVSLYDAEGRFLDTRSDPLRGAANDVLLRRAVSTSGKVCVVVEDVDGTAADPEVPYTIEVRLVDEPDPNDVGTRNDTPAAATSLGRGGTRTGSIFSPGDLDWFRVDADAGELLDVEVTCDDCAFDLAVDLVYGHEASPCSGTDSCDYLLTSKACADGKSCASGVCREADGASVCAESCNADSDCPSFQCQQAGGVKACVGGAVCVPEGAGGRCGVVQYGEVATSRSSQQIAFSQPVLRGPVWILIHDFRDDDWSDGTYELKVSLREDPDPNERGGTLNNFYMPYTDVTNLQDVLRRGKGRATPAPWQDVVEIDDDTDEEVVIAKEASGFGCIGFTADVDVFRIQGGNPCVAPDETDPAKRRVNCGMTLEVSRPAGGDMNLTWFIMNENMGARASFSESTLADPIFGDAACVGTQARECNVYNANDQGDYHVVVYDSGLDHWDPDGDHCYTWKMTANVVPGCPESCPFTHPMSELCTCEPPAP
ncbi:MAG TPA: hypothetical protein VN033_02005 [Vulgatibacter sp.]|nr:hypothetical protein [Vulgatibacter sp.]